MSVAADRSAVSPAALAGHVRRLSTRRAAPLYVHSRGGRRARSVERELSLGRCRPAARLGVRRVPSSARVIALPYRAALEHHADAGRAGASRMRLTRRGILCLAVVITALGFGLLALAHPSAGARGGRLPTPASVTVENGDSLWSIARKVAPQQDPRAVIDRLMSRNHLAGATLRPGQTLSVG